MNGLSTALIVVGLFFAGGVVSFTKQKMPKGVTAVLAVGAVLCLTAGVLRLEV
ncbi:hypothetical protein ACWZEH_07845 [Streptomyces sp. QTS137]|uniref:hypothetical protein n=1 Tax=Streptomyces sp. KMM 9044 TaxID=2744474 RepID=UPI002150B79A|nr:hypothetical protein [Streptomyces sp. KMM 9044]WAX80544.1 hypothetical protein HUV60_025640 [Streptomyces sp. KMM 9044]